MDGIKQLKVIGLYICPPDATSFNLVLWASTCTCTRQLEDNDLYINGVKFMTPGSMALVVILWTRVYCNHLETQSTFIWNVMKLYTWVLVHFVTNIFAPLMYN